MNRTDSLTTLKKVLKIIARYRFLLILSVFLASVSVVLQLYIPIIFGRAIDQILGQGQVHFTQIQAYLWQILVLLLIAGVASWVMNLINNRLTYQTVQEIRARAIRQVERLPLKYLDSHASGDTVQRIIGDVDQLSDGLLLGFSQLFSGVVAIFVTIGFMLSKDFIITAMVLILTPVSFLVARYISGRSYKMFRKQTTTRGQQTALINEMVGNEKIVKAFGHEAQASQQFAHVNQELQTYSQEAIFFSSLTNPSTRAVNNIIYALVALVGALRIMANSLTVGGLTVLLAYANQYMKPFNDISSVITELQNSLACAARVFALIEAEPESPDPDQALPEAQGLIAIDHVDFAYDPAKPLIQDFTFTAKPGMKVALVGPTGCGKTTFINLLMRFYDTDKNHIKIDGYKIKEVSRKSLRQNFGMVLQETWIKEGTVRENIILGKPQASEEEIIQAAKDSHSWDFIQQLPQGLDTFITDESLSQGQKQLLCITRVMLQMPPMLILDEATSSIDTRTELKIQAAFDKLMENKTSFIVAHRLSTIQNADCILVMKAGKIIEQGNHDSLMAQNGFYTQLYNAQFAKTAE